MMYAHNFWANEPILFKTTIHSPSWCFDPINNPQALQLQWGICGAGAKDFKPYNGLLLRKQQTDEFEMLVEVQIITCLPTQQNQKQIGVIYARFIRDFIIL